MEQQTLASSSSPTHEFSFTISLNSPSTANPLAIDLTPADDIFFHGQLLPLPLGSSTSSLDDFTLPIRNPVANECSKDRGHSFNSYEYNTSNGEFLSKRRAKSKSFSLLRRRSKEAEEEEEEEEAQGEKHKKKPRFDIGHFLKRYMKIFSKERRYDIQFRKKPYSFSGKLRPASMEDSRAPHHHSNDSSMEELQAAIQAAIAHCKNSIATADKAMLS